MVLWDRNYNRIQDPSQLVPPEQQLAEPTPEQLESPGIGQLFGAAFRMENTIGSLIADQTAGLDPLDDDGYDPWPDIKDDPIFVEQQDRFFRVTNSKYAEALKAQIMREREDRMALEAGGVWGLGAGIAAGVFDWTTLLPGGVLVKGVKSAYSVGKSAAVVGAFAGAGTVVQEGALHMTQQTRTAEESLINIGAGTLLGGVFGAAGAKMANAQWLDKVMRDLDGEVVTNIKNNPDVDDLEEGFNATQKVMAQAAEGADEDVIYGPAVEGVRDGFNRTQKIMAQVAEEDVIYGPSVDDVIPSQYMKAGGEGTPTAQAGDIEFTNKTTSILSRFAIANNAMALLRSPVGASRQAATLLAEYGFPLKIKDIVRYGVEGSAETRMKRWTQGAYGRSMDFHNKEYKAYRKKEFAPGEERLNATQFSERVGDALRNGDIDPNSEYVTRVAGKYRKEVFDPLLKEAQELGALPDDIDVKTAQSYFHRMYNVKKVEDGYEDFMRITMQWARRAFADQFVGETPSDINDYVRDIAESIYDKITGLRPDLDPMIRVKPGEKPGRRGPFEERTFTIEDRLIKEFLEDDVRVVAARYARVMGADTEIRRKFGHVDLRDWIGKDGTKGIIGKQYEQIHRRITADKNLTDKQKNELHNRYRKAEKRDRENLAGLRDRLRGTYKLSERNGYFAPVRESVLAWNYMRAMGGVVVSSLNDVSRILMVHGPSRFMMEGILPLVTNFKAIKMSAEQAKQMGAAMEIVLNTRHATWADLTDPYAYGNPVERWLSTASSEFSKFSGIVHWNHLLKSWSAVMSQNRILRNSVTIAEKGFDALPKREKVYMDFVGMSPTNAQQLGQAFKKYGNKEGSIYLLDPSRMAEQLSAEGVTGSNRANFIRSVYESAVIKDVDGTIVTKGIADTPLALDGPVARMIFQFKSFALASHQRMLMRATGGSDEMLGVISGMMSSIGMGSMIYMLKAVERGEEISDNPGKIIAEGVDRSGLFAVLMELNNIGEKWGAPGFFQAMTAAFPDREQSPPASRYAIRNSIGALLGPTYGLGTDAAGVIGSIAKLSNPFQDSFLEPHWTNGDMKAMRRLLPGTTLPYVRWAVERYMIDQ